VPAGHRLRLALAGTDWPNTWPPPGRVELEVDRTSLALELPVVEGPPPITERPTFPPALAPPPADADEARRAPVWRVERDVLERTTRVVVDHGSSYAARFGSQVTESYAGEVGVHLARPEAAWATATTRFEIAWPEVDVATEARLEVRSTAEAFDVVVELDATADGAVVAERRWEERVPRDLL
jgi:hypothetical protein